MKEKRNTKEAFFNLQLFGDAQGTGDEGAVDAGQIFSGEADTDFDDEFAGLIKGKYKDAFTKKTQSIINRRFKETKELEEYKSKTEGILTLLRDRYGTQDGDYDGLINSLQSEVQTAVKADDVSVDGDTASDSEAETKAEKAPYEKLKAELDRDKHYEKTLKQYSRWQAEAEALKELYPDFDLKKESLDPRFTSLLMGGADVRLAYESVHHDEILSGAMEYTARQVSEAMSRNIQARGNRPFENGLGSKAPINPMKDVNSLTDKDISEILKQVEKGKIIRF